MFKQTVQKSFQNDITSNVDVYVILSDKNGQFNKIHTFLQLLWYNRIL